MEIQGLLQNDESSGHNIALHLTHKDGSDPTIVVTMNEEDTLDWLVVSDVNGEILKIDEEFNITYGDDYKKRLSRVLARKAPVPVPES